MKESICPRCGESVCFEDYGDNSAFLSGKCEGCGLKWDYTEGQRFNWEVWDENELRLERARKALRKAIASEESKYNPSESLLRAYRDGLKAIGG